jgi:hypothetical protein
MVVSDGYANGYASHGLTGVIADSWMASPPNKSRYTYRHAANSGKFT